MFASKETKAWRGYQTTWKSTPSYTTASQAIGDIITRRYRERQLPSIKRCVIVGPGQLSIPKSLPGMTSVGNVDLFYLAIFLCLRDLIGKAPPLSLLKVRFVSMLKAKTEPATKQAPFTKDKPLGLAYAGDYRGVDEGVLRSANVQVITALDASSITESFVYIRRAPPEQIAQILNLQPGIIFWDKMIAPQTFTPQLQPMISKFLDGAQSPIPIPLTAGEKRSDTPPYWQFTRPSYLQWRLPGTLSPPEYSDPAMTVDDLKDPRTGRLNNEPTLRGTQAPTANGPGGRHPNPLMLRRFNPRAQDFQEETPENGTPTAVPRFRARDSPHTTTLPRPPIVKD